MASIQCPLVMLDLKSKDLHQEILALTNGDGVARLVEATGMKLILKHHFSFPPLDTVVVVHYP